jgi:hypothetical protein
MLEEIVPLEPVHFFAFQLDCLEAKGGKLDKRHFLPDLAAFHQSTSFAQVALGWHESGIYAQVHVDGAFESSDFPNFSEADSIEFFFDTRDVKTTGFNTRFCHHFFFLPESLPTNGGLLAGEITRFRTEDVHPLCDPSLLQVTSVKEKRKRILHIFIPSECLHGYDPTQFDRLGFTYQINRISGAKQSFSASRSDFSIESQPSLWASLKLVKK